MKTILTSGLFLAALACSGPQSMPHSRYAFSDLAEKADKTDKRIIAAIKADRQESLDHQKTQGRQPDPFDQFFATMDEYEYYRIPIYEMDLDAFHAAPAEENIQSCIRPTDIVNFVAIKDGNIKTRFTATPSPTGWFASEATMDYGKAIGWLRDTLARAGTKAYKIFTVGGLEWVTYNHGSEARYFTITGQPYTPSQFCEYCVEKYKQGQEFRKAILENPEMFPDMYKQLMEEEGNAAKTQ